MAGLRFDKDWLANFFRDEIMEESVVYQDIIQKGRKQEAIVLIMGMLTRGFGTLEPDIMERIRLLSTTQWEDLS